MTTEVAERTCMEFGHPLGALDIWADTPDCPQCAELLAAQWRLERQVTRGETLATHLVCGRISGAVLTMGGGRFDAVNIVARGWHPIGRRESKARALAAVAASHECV